jgi:hypothetical protein
MPNSCGELYIRTKDRIIGRCRGIRRNDNVRMRRKPGSIRFRTEYTW